MCGEWCVCVVGVVSGVCGGCGGCDVCVVCIGRRKQNMDVRCTAGLVSVLILYFNEILRYDWPIEGGLFHLYTCKISLIHL